MRMKRILLYLFFLSYLFSKAQTGIWGVTSAGGRFNAGVIFKTDGSGDQFTVKKELFRFDGEFPKSKLLQASNGKLYGLSSDCCVLGSYGVFFEYDPATKNYNKIVDFNDTINGSSPDGGLVEAMNGKLYGLTSTGGIHNKGTLFEFDPSTYAFKKIYDFDETNGSTPLGTLIQATDGKLYGLTSSGGANDYGVLFQYDISTGTYSNKFNFDGTKGGNPLGDLIQAKNGLLYGLTSSGGKDNNGVLFEYDPAGATYMNKIDFNGTSQGGWPYGSLLEAADGNLYGLTNIGGSDNFGVLFQYTPSTSAYTVKVDFNGTVRGAYPKSSLTAGANGKLYGITEYGGDFDEGVIFEYDPASSVYTKKFDFDNTGKLTGNYPVAELTQATDGFLYGLAYTGGIAGTGVLFRFDPVTSSYTKEFDFHTSANGVAPVAAFVAASDNMLYGITKNGGIKNNGAIYQYDPGFETYIKKFDFDKNSSGASPNGSLIQATNGSLYGTCMEGGAHNKGVLFRFDPVTNAFEVKVEFNGDNGYAPYGELLQANDGKIYGMTHEGGTANNGVLFQFDPVTSVFTKKFDFDNNATGKYPEGGLIQGNDGKLYGLTSQGGNITSASFPDGLGVLFQFDPVTGNLTKKIDFNGTTLGSFPCGSLAKTADGKLYGLTSSGGNISSEFPLGCGVLFQYDPASSIAEGMFSFNGVENGTLPNGSLLAASDGNLYGVTSRGGVYDMGVLFRFDPKASVFVKKTDFKHTTGKYPEYGKLIEIPLVNSISTAGSSQMNMHVYPNPATSNVNITLTQPVNNATLKLKTISGQCILEKTNISGTQFSITIVDVAKGAYFLEIQTTEYTLRTKLIRSE